MERQFKALSFTNIKAAASGRKRAGVCAVFGNVDAYADRIHPGAFLKSIQENFKQVKHLWNHDYWQPPIASIKELRELSKDELPAEVLEKAPDATGGLLVAREYYADNPLSEWILKAIDAGDINEMSFAFDVVKYEVTEEETGMDDMPKRRVRELRELKLFDTSDVNWGMNSATVAVGAKNLRQKPLGLIYADLLQIEQEIKAGRRNSGDDQKLLDLIHETSVALGAACSPKQDDEESEPKSAQKKAEAVNSDTSLFSQGLQVQKLQIEEIFTI